MARFQIRYGLGGGFGGAGEWEDAKATTLQQAEEEAYQAAREVYESYEGMYGLRTGAPPLLSDNSSYRWNTKGGR